MEPSALLLFALTAVPLVFTPGPDILFVTAQAVAGGRGAALRGTAGVLLGYALHGALAALGVAAVVAAHPLLFEALRWIGVGYLAFLAVMLIRSATRVGRGTIPPAAPTRGVLIRGFLTSFLNPKGLMMYFAIIPQFIDPVGSVALQAGALSATFVALCGVGYGLVGITASALRIRGVGDRGRRALEGVAGGLLAVAAGRLAAS